MKINAYLNYNGNCAEAFRFYERVLGGKIVFLQTHGDSPMADQTPPQMRDLVMHVRLEVGDQLLMGSDAPPQYFEKQQGVWVSLMFTDVAEAERIYKELADGAEVRMELQKTFWAERFAMLIDRFGTPWMINCGE